MSQEEQVNSQEENESVMESSLAARAKDESFWKDIWRQVRLVWFLMRDSEVPVYLKLLPLAAFIYVLIPTDLIPDFLPVLGQLDDLTALLVGAKVFIELSPPQVVARQIQTMRQQIDTTANQNQDQETSPTDLEDAIIIEGDYQLINEDSEDGTT